MFQQKNNLVKVWNLLKPTKIVTNETTQVWQLYFEVYVSFLSCLLQRNPGFPPKKCFPFSQFTHSIDKYCPPLFIFCMLSAKVRSLRSVILILKIDWKIVHKTKTTNSIEYETFPSTGQGYFIHMTLKKSSLQLQHTLSDETIGMSQA